MVTLKNWLIGGALALLLGLAGCGSGATVTAPPATAAGAPVGATAATARPATATAGMATTVPATAPVTATRATTVATPTTATPLPGATATRAGTARATASPGRSPTATDAGIKTAAIRLGQSALLPEEGLSLDFVAVAGDSRCPRSANGVTIACAWAGEATIELAATRGGASKKLTLIMPGLSDNAAQGPDNPKTYTTFEGYKIQVQSLEPQPSVDGSKPGEYVVTLLVSKVP